MKTWQDEAKLIADCKKELPYNHRSFEILIGRYKDLVFTLCYRLVGNSNDAEDLMQEVFTKIFLNLKNFEERSKFSSWIYRITHNHCVNFINRRVREKEVIGEFAEETTRIKDAASAVDLTGKMQEALIQIESDKRSLLIMKYVLELDLKEIAAALELSIGAVKMRLLRAREEFRKVYKTEE